MADPVNYNVTFDFSAYQTGNPRAVPPGTKLDVEFAQIQASIATLVDAVKDVRRSDGKLQNGLVTIETLSPAALTGVQGPPGPAGPPGVNVTISQSLPSGGADGDFWLVVG